MVQSECPNYKTEFRIIQFGVEVENFALSRVSITKLGIATQHFQFKLRGGCLSMTSFHIRIRETDQSPEGTQQIFASKLLQ